MKLVSLRVFVWQKMLNGVLREKCFFKCCKTESLYHTNLAAEQCDDLFKMAYAKEISMALSTWGYSLSLAWCMLGNV